MIKLFITFFLLSSSLLTYGQEDFYLIQFKNKDATTYSLDNPDKFLSERAIQRRRSQSIAIDSTDLPVVQSYIDEVLNTGAVIWYPLKWMNALIISNADSALIAEINSVDKVMNMADKSIGGIEKNRSYNSDFGEAAGQLNLLGIDRMHEQGYKGEGIHIAVLDAGFKNYSSNPYFENLLVGETYDLYEKDTVVSDDHSHGADVLSTMAAYKEGSYIGGSPDATFFLYRTENVFYENRVEELMWIAAAERADSIGVDIIQSSLGYYSFDDETQDYSHDDLDGNTAWISIGANHAYSKGIVVVSSAGNEGGNVWQKVSFPSDSPFVLSVGSVNINNLERAFSSSIGPTIDNRIKPDVMAVGSGVQVVKSSGSIGVSSGTSFSAPQVSSLVAGLLQALPEGTTPMDVMSRIKKSGDNASLPDTLIGYGIPDFNRAFLLTASENDKAFFNDIKIFPNPVDGNTVKIELPHNLNKNSLEFVWFSMSGKTLKKETKNIVHNILALELPSNYRDQYLLLKVVSESYYKTFKIKVN